MAKDDIKTWLCEWVNFKSFRDFHKARHTQFQFFTISFKQHWQVNHIGVFWWVNSNAIYHQKSACLVLKIELFSFNYSLIRLNDFFFFFNAELGSGTLVAAEQLKLKKRHENGSECVLNNRFEYCCCIIFRSFPKRELWKISLLEW